MRVSQEVTRYTHVQKEEANEDVTPEQRRGNRGERLERLEKGAAVQVAVETKDNGYEEWKARMVSVNVVIAVDNGKGNMEAIIR